MCTGVDQVCSGESVFTRWNVRPTPDSTHNPGGIIIGVHRDRRLLRPLRGAHPTRNVAKLRVSVGMLAPLARLDVPLQAIAEAVQQLRDHRVTDAVAQAVEGDGQRTRTQAGPPQREIRIAGRRRFDQGVEVAQQRRVARGRPLPPPTRLPCPVRRQRRRGVELPEAPSHRGRGDARRAGDEGGAAIAERSGFRRRPEPT